MARRLAANLADGYTQDGRVEPHDERSRPSAAGSMDSPIEDQARLWAGVMRGEGLSDVRAERIYPELARRVLGETDMPWRWEYGWYQP